MSICPKCKQDNYDVRPNLLNVPELQSKDVFIDKHSFGQAKYYCSDCDYTWKKYRGKKPYELINIIYAEAGGYPGPYFKVKINLKEKEIEHHVVNPEGNFDNDSSVNTVTTDDIQWFRSELHKCDFVNWAEEYVEFGVLDGGHWRVRIEYDNYCEIKTGSNHVPLKWAKFCKSISRLGGHDFY